MKKKGQMKRGMESSMPRFFNGMVKEPEWILKKSLRG